MLHNQVSELPENLDLVPWGEWDMARTTSLERRIFLRRSESMWVISDERNNSTLLVAGIIRPTQLSIPELWILLCNGFKKNLRENLIAVRGKLEELLELYPHVMVKVDAETPAGRKLVEFLGFTEYHRDVSSGREYIYYEVRK